MSRIAANYMLSIPYADKDFIERVDTLAREVLAKRYNIEHLSPFMVTTVATNMIEGCVKLLSLKIQTDGTSATVNFHDLLTFHVSFVHDEEAEKESNTNVIVRAGVKAKKFEHIDLNISLADRSGFIVPDSESSNFKTLDLIDKVAQRELFETNGLGIGRDWMATTITIVFVEQLFHELLDEFIAAGGETVTREFNEVVAFNCILDPSVEDDEVLDATKLYEKAIFIIHPRSSAKLLIKSDEANMIKDGE